jgi:hypothetical protein
MEAESRKRAHVGDDDLVQKKKRVLSSANGSPHVNGVAEKEEPTDTDDLEVKNGFRELQYVVNDVAVAIALSQGGYLS